MHLQYAPSLPGIGRSAVGPVIATLLWAGGACAQTESHLTGTPEAMVELDRPSGWSVGAHVRMDRRELKAGDDLLRLDVNYALARVGYAPVPFFQVYGELGWDRADNEDAGVKGESGLAWSAGLLGNFVEYVMRTSPVTGKKEAFSLGGELAYRRSESNFPDQDLNWGELIVLPTAQYTRNYEGEWDRFRLAPPAILVRGGVLFSSIDGEFGDADVKGNRDFALHLAVATRWRGSWAGGVYGNFYGSSDRSVGLELAYHF